MNQLALVLTSIALAASAASANAATVSYGFVDPLDPTRSHLSMFDTALGTLTGATLFVYGQDSLQLTVKPIGPGSVVAEITSTVDLTWDSTLDLLDSFVADVMTLSFTTGSRTFVAGGTYVFGPNSRSASNTDDLASVLGGLQTPGGGSFDLVCQWGSLRTTSTGGGFSFATSTAGPSACGASIEYAYDAAPAVSVPEPGTLALIALALAGIGLRARRRTG